MASKEDLGIVEFGPADLRGLEEVAVQLGACRQAAEKAGKPATTLAIFLKMTDEHMSTFIRDLKERMRAVPRTA